MKSVSLSEVARPPVELPLSNPERRHGTTLPAEGDEGLFSQSWFPICLSAEVGPGEVRGEPFLDGKVIAYRGSDGVARVMSAYCPHLGADLSLGCVVDGAVRCAFHQWEYDSQGRCRRTAIGDKAPKSARLFKFPSIERYGVIWAFNGNEPLWEIPDFQYPDDELAVRVFRFDETFKCDPWVFAANTPDMQHLKVVHQAKFSAGDPHELVQWDDWGFRYPIIAEHQGGVPIEWLLGIRGTSLFWQEGPYGDFWIGGMVGFALPTPGEHRVFAILALHKKGATEEQLSERFAAAEMLMNRTIGEDKDILNSIHYRQGVLTRGDTTLSRYLKFLRAYPRAHPSAEFIR